MNILILNGITGIILGILIGGGLRSICREVFRDQVFKDVRSNNLDRVKLGVKILDDLNIRDDSGYTLLDIAIYKGYTDIARFLIEEGIDVNSRDTNGWEETPLHRAVYLEDTEIVKLLLEKGADIHAQSWLGCTPLDIAKEERFFDIIDLLIEHDDMT